MKRALMIGLIWATVFSAVVVAGPYFIVENEGLFLEPSLVIGWDFVAPFVDFSNMSISGDFYIENENLAVYPTPWIGGFGLGFSFANPLGATVFEVGLSMDVGLTPSPSPLEVATLDSWTTSIEIVGYPGDVVAIYGAIDLGYDVVWGGSAYVGTWNFEPTIGIEVHWP